MVNLEDSVFYISKSTDQLIMEITGIIIIVIIIIL